jgi:hypothetical protein
MLWVRMDAARMLECDAWMQLASVWTRAEFPWTQAYVRADVLIYPRGNFITDTAVRPSHRKPSRHHPIVRLIVRPFALNCLRDNPGALPRRPEWSAGTSNSTVSHLRGGIVRQPYLYNQRNRDRISKVLVAP